jgi:hypothetical protein
MKKSALFLLALVIVRAVGAAITYNGSDIYNVQNYSSSPFYSTGGAYNHRFPAPVYVKGPQLGAAECELAVNSAIWTQCSFRNNCANITLAEIRPAIMLELSNRTDGNYTSCGGYIDALFNQYRQQTAGAVVSTDFPSATRPADYGSGIQPANPYNYGTLTPYYEQAQDMRQYQLQNMQRQVAPQPVAPTPTAAPETFADLSFTERMDILREGWQDPAVGKSSYQQITNLENDTEMLTRQETEESLRNQVEREREQLLKQTDIDEWCKQYPAKCETDGDYLEYIKNKDIDAYCNDHMHPLRWNEDDCVAYLKQTNYDKWCDGHLLDCDVEKFQRGEMPLAEFRAKHPDHAITKAADDKDRKDDAATETRRHNEELESIRRETADQRNTSPENTNTSNEEGIWFDLSF